MKRLKEWREERTYANAVKRLSRVSNVEAINWAEQSINHLHVVFDTLRKTDDQAARQAARDAVLCLLGTLEVIDSRAQ